MKTSTWELDPKKFLTRKETLQLLAAAEIRTEAWLQVTIRDHFIVDLGLSTGLRVMEIAALKCGDLDLETRVSCLLVREGKGSKKRRVFFNDNFRKHCKEYLTWKESIGESTEPDQPLLISTRTGGHEVLNRWRTLGLPIMPLGSVSFHTLPHR